VGSELLQGSVAVHWIPAFAGMTILWVRRAGRAPSRRIRAGFQPPRPSCRQGAVPAPEGRHSPPRPSCRRGVGRHPAAFLDPGLRRDDESLGAVMPAWCWPASSGVLSGQEAVPEEPYAAL